MLQTERLIRQERRELGPGDPVSPGEGQRQLPLSGERGGEGGVTGS